MVDGNAGEPDSALGDRGAVGASVAIDAAVKLLEDCASFIESTPDRIYQAPSQMLPGGTIGKHMRHLIDHYMAITRAIGDGEAIQYDRREREVVMESCRGSAGRAIAEAANALRDLGDLEAERGVRVRLLTAADRAEVEVGSTVARELLFATHHAVHHCAMMKAIALEFGVKEMRGGPTFGLAPATVRSLAGGGA